MWAMVIAVGVATAIVGTWLAHRDLTYRGQRDAVAAMGVGVVIATIGVVGAA